MTNLPNMSGGGSGPLPPGGAGNIYPDPMKEFTRLEALENYEILDTSPEPAFDDLTRLAAYICEAPISLISLVDAQRQWFKSKLGLEIPETPREISFCQYTILQQGVFEVEDATKNDIFRSNPLVTGEPNIRFYAGAPLLTQEGFSLGSLCIIDTVPRSLSPKQKDALQSLARSVVSNLELRRAKFLFEAEKEKLDKLLKLANSTVSNGFITGKTDIFVKQESKLVKVCVQDILWIEALGDYVNIHTDKERFTVYATMKDMEAKLPGNDFVRVHRKYIVRLDKIITIEDDTAVIEKRDIGNSGHIMNGLMYVPIGNSFKPILMKRLNLI